MTLLDRACLSLGDKCNLDCTYCHFTPRLQGGSQTFNESELLRIIDNIANHCDRHSSLFKLGLVGSGEPLLQFDKIQAVVEHVRNRGYKAITFYTVTNGTLMKPEHLDFFYRHRDTIAVCYSLDGDEPLHNLGRERFAAVWKSIERYEAQFGVKPAINCTVHRSTLERAEEVCAFFVSNGFTQVTFSPLFDVNDPAFMVSDAEFADFLLRCSETSLVLRQTECAEKKKYDCAKYGSLCGVGRNNPFITHNGIYPCGRFYGDPNYRLADFDVDLAVLEAGFSRITPVKDGHCYFDEHCLDPAAEVIAVQPVRRRANQ